MESKTEIMQSMMLACSEAEFFSSVPVFVHHMRALQASLAPVDLIVPSFTLLGAGALLSEQFAVPMAGFVLQPSCIPSSDPAWKVRRGT